MTEHTGEWTQQDIKTLRKLYKDNNTADVAKVLGRPEQAVRKKASRLGLTKSKRRMKALGRK